MSLPNNVNAVGENAEKVAANPDIRCFVTAFTVTDSHEKSHLSACGIPEKRPAQDGAFLVVHKLESIFHGPFFRRRLAIMLPTTRHVKGSIRPTINGIMRSSQIDGLRIGLSKMGTLTPASACPAFPGIAESFSR